MLVGHWLILMAVIVIVMIVIVVWAVVVMMVTGSPAKFQPRGDPNPASKSNQGETGNKVYDLAETGRKSDPCYPDSQTDYQGRHDMSNSCLERCSGRLCFGPTSLASHQRDGHPMIGDYSVKNTDRGDREHEEESVKSHLNG